MTPDLRPKVLYVLGTQRGGTTIGGRLIGRLPGFCFVGELRKLWQLGVAEDRRCGCGLSYGECPLWSVVLPPILAGTDAAQVQRWQRVAVPDRRSSLQARRLARDGDRGHAETVAAYTQTLAATYRGLAEATSARVLVDTSKLPADAALVERMAEVEPYFLHLVRDPRGTVHSTIRRATPGSRAHVRQSLAGSAGWMVRHLAATSLVRRVGPERSLVISYENMVSDPNAVLDRVAILVGEPAPPAPVVVDGRVDLEVAHTPIGGGRFGPATVTLAVDERWADDLGAVDRALVTGLTLPLAHRFGYRMSAPPTTGDKNC